MPTNATREQEATDGELPARPPAGPPITGPHVGYDQFGDVATTYYRCERCGTWSVDETFPDEGCWNCGAGGHENRQTGDASGNAD